MKVGPAKHTDGGFICFGRYGDGSTAIQIFSDQGPQATATVSVDAPLPDDKHVWLKGWSENEGIPDALEKAGICQRTGQKHHVGFVEAELAMLSEEAIKAREASECQK